MKNERCRCAAVVSAAIAGAVFMLAFIWIAKSVNLYEYVDHTMGQETGSKGLYDTIDDMIDHMLHGTRSIDRPQEFDYFIHGTSYSDAFDVEDTPNGVRNAHAEVDWTDASEGSIRVRSFDGPSRQLTVRVYDIDIPGSYDLYYLDRDGAWTEIELTRGYRHYPITVCVGTRYYAALDTSVVSEPKSGPSRGWDAFDSEDTSDGTKNTHAEVDWTDASEGRIRVRSLEGPSMSLAVRVYAPGADRKSVRYDLDPDGEWTEIELDSGSGCYDVVVYELHKVPGDTVLGAYVII